MTFPPGRRDPNGVLGCCRPPAMRQTASAGTLSGCAQLQALTAALAWAPQEAGKKFYKNMIVDSQYEARATLQNCAAPNQSCTSLPAALFAVSGTESAAAPLRSSLRRRRNGGLERLREGAMADAGMMPGASGRAVRGLLGVAHEDRHCLELGWVIRRTYRWLPAAKYSFTSQSLRCQPSPT